MRSRFRTTAFFALLLSGILGSGLGPEAAAAPGADQTTDKPSNPDRSGIEVRPAATVTPAAAAQAGKTSGAAEADLLRNATSPQPSPAPAPSPSEVASHPDQAEGKTSERDDAAIEARPSGYKHPAAVDASNTVRNSESPPSSVSPSSVSPSSVAPSSALPSTERPPAQESHGRQEALVTCITTKDGRARCRQGRGDLEALALPQSHDGAAPALASCRSAR